MKYISLSSTVGAFHRNKVTTTCKFWGILAILSSLEECIVPGKCYKFRADSVSNFLESLFHLNEETKQYTNGTIWTVVFSSNWLKKFRQLTLKGTANIYDIATWYFRNREFADSINREDISRLFLECIHITEDEARTLFDFNKTEIDFSNTIYNDKQLLSGLNIDGNNLTPEGTFSIAYPGELSRGPFIQPLYASQSMLECLIISQYDVNDLYFHQNCSNSHNTTALQTIYFGSPGTGKSRQVKDSLKDVPEGQIFRTTFHPDSDYASFVGCYKPMCHSVAAQTCKVLDYDELVAKLKQTLGEHSSNLTSGFALFGFECRESILDMEKSGEHTISKLVEDAYKAGSTYDTTIRAGMQIKEETALPESSRISYEFSPQVFTKAYCKVWKNPDKPIYLIIEEINRGNCAQIFGDLFQLLDRKDGVSEYPIDADTDLRFYLEEELSNTEDGETDGSEGIAGGKLRLPSNFNIVATMNTSDQSLFPMDSAFKRRWEWKYIPTTAPKGKDRQMELTIKNSIETKDGRKINAGNYEYSWKDFLSNINARILNVTHSEDKQLGYWFVKADEVSGGISISTFVSKVVFYLWNDVFKDVGAKDTNPFTIKVNGKNEIMSFNSFFEENTEGKVVESLGVLHTFLANVGLTPEPVLMEKSETDGGSGNGNEDQSGSE